MIKIIPRYILLHLGVIMAGWALWVSSLGLIENGVDPIGVILSAIVLFLIIASAMQERLFPPKRWSK